MQNIRSLSQKGLTIALATAVALMGLLFFAPKAGADKQPGTCTAPGVGIFLEVFKNDETTPISGGDSVAIGQTIKYRATLSHPGTPVCNFEGGTLTITTPDLTVHTVASPATPVVPLVSFGSPFISVFVSYTVNGAHIGGDADLDASTSYTGGESHTGTTHSTLNAGTNVETPLKGKIIVEKQTLPDGSGQLFAFTGSVSGSISDGLTLELEVDPGQYTSTETPIPAGWDLTSIVCNDANSSGVVGTGVATFNVESNETVKCTFTNTQRGHIIVDKVTNPSQDPQSFDFTAGGAGYSNFSLTDVAAPNNQEVVPGAYTVSETVPAGWSSDGGVCDNDETPASLDVGPGETVTCTFTNEVIATSRINALS